MSVYITSSAAATVFVGVVSRFVYIWRTRVDVATTTSSTETTALLLLLFGRQKEKEKKKETFWFRFAEVNAIMPDAMVAPNAEIRSGRRRLLLRVCPRWFSILIADEREQFAIHCVHKQNHNTLIYTLPRWHFLFHFSNGHWPLFIK